MSALALNNGFQANYSLASGILFHPDLMIFGVIGGLLITEKLELMEKFPIVGGIPISRPTVIFLFTGVFTSSLGILAGNSILRYAGLLLVIGGSILFLLYMTSRRNPGDLWIKMIFGAAIASMALAAVGNLTFFIFDNVEATYLALLFPIIYILAERMELGFVRGMKKRILAMQTFIAWSAVILAFTAVTVPTNFSKQAAMYISIGLVISLILISMYFDPAFRKLRRRGKFQRFMRSGVITSFFWLMLGLALFVLQMATGHGYLDAATHAIALGFIGTFIVAHSPIIFPLTLKKKANQENVTFIPLIVLTMANVARVFGDLGTHYSSYGFAISYISGYLILIAIIAFIYNLKRIMASPKSFSRPKELDPVPDRPQH